MTEQSERNYGEGPARAVGAVPPFVGRRQQLDQLERCLRAMLSGRPQVVLLQGDAGVGKTRLLKEGRALALRLGVNVCYGRCYEDLALPYLPFAESLFLQLQKIPADIQRALGADMTVISRLLQWGDVASPAASPSLSAKPDQDTLRLFVALSRATMKLAQVRPLLLAVDDLHWADPPSLDLFSHLVFAVADAAVQEPVPLLIIGTYRPAPPEGRLARAIVRFQREEICQTLHLAGLNESELDELIQGLGVTSPSYQLIATVREATQGNPLFVQEVLHQLVRQHALAEHAGYVVTTASPADLKLPDQVATAIAARTQELGEDCRRVLTQAAFLGERFSLQTLGAVSGVGEGQLLDLMEEGMRHRLIVNEGELFQFAHPLIRQVLHSTPSAVRRQHIHLQIAQTLERLYAAGPDAHLLEIAHHIVSAGPAASVEKVMEYACRASDQACALFAWGEAARYAETALSAAESTGRLSAHDRAELHYRAGFAHYRNMDIGPCLEHYEAAVAAYRQSGDMPGLARTLMAKTRAYFTQASVPYGTLIDVRPLEEMLQVLGDAEPELRGYLSALIAEVYWHGRQTGQAERMARQALAIGRQGENRLICSYANHVLALAQVQSLRVREALRSWQDALAYARQVDDLWLQSWPLSRIPTVFLSLGQLDEAKTAALEGCTSAQKIHNWADYSLGLSTVVSVAVARGDFATAERRAREVMAMVRRSHYPWSGAAVASALACAHALRGAWADAEEAVGMLAEPGRIFAEPGPAVQVVAWTYRQLVRAYSGAGPDDEEIEQLASVLLGLGGTDLLALAGFCALVEIGDLVRAPSLAAGPYQVLSLAAERGVNFSTGWLFLIQRILGVIATLNRWWDKGEAHFRAAIDLASRVGARPELGRSYLDYARMLVTRDAESDRQRALRLARQASVIFDELAMEPFARRARQVAETLGVRLPPPPRQQPQAPDSRGPQQSSPSEPPVVVPPLVIVFTDMVGSTALIQRLGDVRAQELLRAHNAIIRRCLSRHEGTEIKHTGDGIKASFVSASGALECAIAIQRAFAQYNQAHPDLPLHVRIGLNAGEPIAEEGQLFGAAVNAARRICDRAKPGQILVSDVVRQLAAGKGFVFTERGRVALKGFKERFRLYALQWDGGNV